jgi:hypothetical protein
MISRRQFLALTRSRAPSASRWVRPARRPSPRLPASGEWGYDWRNKRFLREDKFRFAANVAVHAMT